MSRVETLGEWLTSVLGSKSGYQGILFLEIGALSRLALIMSWLISDNIIINELMGWVPGFTVVSLPFDFYNSS